MDNGNGVTLGTYDYFLSALDMVLQLFISKLNDISCLVYMNCFLNFYLHLSKVRVIICCSLALFVPCIQVFRESLVHIRHSDESYPDEDRAGAAQRLVPAAAYYLS